MPALESDLVILRLARKGNLLISSWIKDGELIVIQELPLPEDTTFSVGGVFASTEVEQPLEASFDYAMLIASSADFSSWMAANGFDDPDAEYQDTGMSNLLAYALGRDLNVKVSPAILHGNNTIGFSHRQRIEGGQIGYRVEKSTDMITWEPAGDLTPEGEPTLNPDGTFTINLLSDIPPSGRPETYYRLVVTAF